MRHMATTHPISWFTDREAEGNLTLQPKFQRRRVWAHRQKSNLIESILLQLPIPEIYMQIKTSPEGKSEYIVVDGQQRIGAILDFIGNGERQSFELQQLDQNSPWRGYRFSMLTDVEKTAFYGHSMSVRYLQDASDDEVESLFRRLNKYIVPLNEQELRNATYKGPFIRLSESLAEDSFWSDSRLATTEAIRRMRDIEFVSDLLVGVIHGPQSISSLNDYYSQYEDYEHEFPNQRECRLRFSKALEVIQELFDDLRYTRWSNKTDFYSLFVATTHLLRDHILPGDKFDLLRQRLDEFSGEVDRYLEDDNADVPTRVPGYVDAVRRGSSERSRRGTRHQALLEVMTECYQQRAVRKSR